MIRFMGIDAIATVSQYANNGNVAIRLVAADTEHNSNMDSYPGEPLCNVTINTDGIMPDELCIKNYSENEGLLNLLLAAQWAETPHRYIDAGDAGYVSLPVVRPIGYLADLISTGGYINE